MNASGERLRAADGRTRAERPRPAAAPGAARVDRRIPIRIVRRKSIPSSATASSASLCRRSAHAQARTKRGVAFDISSRAHSLRGHRETFPDLFLLVDLESRSPFTDDSSLSATPSRQPFDKHFFFFLNISFHLSLFCQDRSMVVRKVTH